MSVKVSPKKLRERNLIDQFLRVTPKFKNYKFAFYDENPDLVYRSQDTQLGFESILVIPSNDSRCRLDAATCQLWLPLLVGSQQGILVIQLELARTLFEHLRHYKVPTIIVFTVLAPTVQLEQIAAHFALPEVVEHNIVGFFITDSRRSLQLTKTRRV